MYIPALLSVLVFMIYPFVKGALITFTNWNGFSQVYQWVGFAQYERLFSDPDTWHILKTRALRAQRRPFSKRGWTLVRPALKSKH